MISESERLKEGIKIAISMTDRDIGRTVRKIAECGNTAEVKRNKDGIVILEVKKKIVGGENDKGK